MRNLVLIAASILFCCSFCLAQQANGPSAEEQQMIEQMQQMRQQVLQNMQDKGVDPMEVFGQIRQQMMDGTFDPAAFQQSLVDRGLVTQDMIDRGRETMQRVTQSSIKRQLKVTDDEWKLLEAKIQRVMKARAAVGLNNPMGGGAMMRFMGIAEADSDIAKALSELRAALKDPQTPGNEIAEKLKAWHEARDAAKLELDAAQKDLIGVLTRRQEAVLMAAGVLQ